MSPKHSNTTPAWIAQRFAKLEKLIREQAAAKRLPGTEVAPGGNFLVRGLLSVIGSLDLTGTMSMKTDTGEELVRLGEMPYGRGLEFKRDDGSTAFSFRKLFATDTQQAWSLYDAAGNLIAGEYQVFNGLKAPFLEHPFQPVSPTPGTALTCGPYGIERTLAPAVTTGTWSTLFAYDGKRQNAFVDLKVAAICSDATTAGEVMLVNLNTGTQITGFIDPTWTGVIPTGTTALIVLDPTAAQSGIHAAGGVGGQMRIGLQVRRTAGAGTITISVPQSIGG